MLTLCAHQDIRIINILTKNTQNNIKSNNLILNTGFNVCVNIKYTNKQ